MMRERLAVWSRSLYFGPLMGNTVMADIEEKILASKLLYEGKLVKLYRDTVELPDGKQAYREIIRHPGAVAMVPLLPDCDVLLVRQYRTAAQKILLEIPAGTLEPGEDPLEAAARELREEIGYRPGKLVRLGAEYTAPGYTSELIHLFLATELESARLEADADEFLEVVRLPLAEAVRQVVQGEILDGKTQVALLLTARYLERTAETRMNTDHE
jgi:ADP-ribose pyrophosphatase